MIIKTSDSYYFKWCKQIRSEKGKIIFFNGVFDIVHLGHLQMFNYIKNINGFKIVGLNSDLSTKLQNKAHPLINTEIYRAKFLKELGFENIIIFDNPTPCNVLWNIMPDIIVKGSEYKDKTFPEKIIAEKIGCNIKYYQSDTEMSTTKIIETVKERC